LLQIQWNLFLLWLLNSPRNLRRFWLC